MAAYITVLICVGTALRGRYYVYPLQRLSAIATKRRYYYYYYYYMSFVVIFMLFSVVKKFDNRLRSDQVKANFLGSIT